MEMWVPNDSIIVDFYSEKSSITSFFTISCHNYDGVECNW